MIREADSRDAEALARLHALVFREPWDARAMEDLLTSAGALAFVSDQGFILVRAVLGEAEILTLAVMSAARRRGLGRALVETAAEALTNAGAHSLFLEVAADNSAALALYAAAGFQRVGRRAGYYRSASGPAVDALVLRRTLKASPA